MVKIAFFNWTKKVLAYIPIYKKIREFKVSAEKTFFKPKELRVNVGGGRFYKRGWKVLDYRTPWYEIPIQYIDYNFDLMTEEPFPFSDDSVSLFYTEHVLEHLPDRYSTHVIQEMYRCLQHKGAVRIVVPDIDLAYKAAKENDSSFFYNIDEYYRKYEKPVQCLVHMFAGYFVRSNHTRNVHMDIDLLQKKFNNLAKEDFLNFFSQQIASWLTPEIQHQFGGFHVNWFNEAKLTKILEDKGFTDVYKTGPQQSRYSEMQGVWFDARPNWSLHLEAVKMYSE